MTKKSKTILFFGTENFSLSALKSLIEADYKIGAVITKPDTPRGRGHKLTPPLVKTLAIEHGIPVWQPRDIRDIKPDISKLDDPVGVLSSYGKIIPQSILDLFTPGIINIHPSLLPKYRGPSPIESAILNGDELTGVSIMRLVSKMDAGPVYAQESLELTGTEAKPELYEKLSGIGSSLLLKKLPAILDGTLQPEPQNESNATYCALLKKSDGQLNPLEMTAEQAERKIRAYIGFPKTRLKIEGEDVIITKAHTASQPKTPLDLQFLGGAFLIIDELIAPSGRTMSAEAYLHGRR